MPNFIYTYACHEDERALCHLELRAFFGQEPTGHYLLSPINIDPSRSPFIKLRISLLYEGESIEVIVQQVAKLELNGATFKVVFAETESAEKQTPSFEEQRLIEREVGWHIQGKADMRQPERTFAIGKLDGRWFFGESSRNEAIWLKHVKKPQNYSTALSTRAARAIVNIAVPNYAGVKVVDPCCGIGTVVIEALSMGIDIEGYDINPLAIRGARLNIAHFGFEAELAIRDMRDIKARFDTAILDLPYNLCSKVSLEEQQEMLQSARRLANSAVIVTTEPLDAIIEQAGFRIVDRCHLNKGVLSRQIIVCL
jgi:tRNA G10  N-methylase Trm11